MTGRRYTAAEAVEIMRAGGYEPLEDYPGGANLLWRVMCIQCGGKRRPKVYDVREGLRCHCRKRYVSDADCAQEMRDAGMEPLAPYPGSGSVGWPARCMRCGHVRSYSLAHVRARGEGCTCKKRTFVSVESCAGELRAAGFEPKGTYPGRVDVPWAAVCTACGEERAPTLHGVRRGHRCRCRRASRVTHIEAIEELRQFGYSPKEAYPGAADLPWAVVCKKCSRPVEVVLRLLRVGRGCDHRGHVDAPGPGALERAAEELGVTAEKLRAVLSEHDLLGARAR